MNRWMSSAAPAITANCNSQPHHGIVVVRVAGFMISSSGKWMMYTANARDPATTNGWHPRIAAVTDPRTVQAATSNAAKMAAAR